MTRNRRRSERLPVGFYVEQIVDDSPHRCFTTDLSTIGIYVERLAQPASRHSSTVQLEIPLPATGETLWASGEVVYDRLESLFHGTAIRFTQMARLHQRLLREWLRETRKADRFEHLNPLRPKVQIRRPAPLA